MPNSLCRLSKYGKLPVLYSLNSKPKALKAYICTNSAFCNASKKQIAFRGRAFRRVISNAKYLILRLGFLLCKRKHALFSPLFPGSQQNSDCAEHHNCTYEGERKHHNKKG